MAKFRNLNPVGTTLGRRHGGRLFVNAGQVIEVEDAEFIERLETRGDFEKVKEVVEHKVGAGLKTNVRKPKSSSKATRAKPKKEVKSKSKAKPKKGKGLRKPKRAD
tara:strand:- start:274 stop:591 length:318 start_codon:yes stop_codon:yes gene_type:complete